MRKFIVLGAIVIAAMFALCAPQPAGAFISNQNGIATASHATTNTHRSEAVPAKGNPAGLASRQKKGLARRPKTAWPNVTENFAFLIAVAKPNPTSSRHTTICSRTMYCNSKPSPN